jgi:hypothetical protein
MVNVCGMDVLLDGAFAVHESQRVSSSVVPDAFGIWSCERFLLCLGELPVDSIELGTGRVATVPLVLAAYPASNLVFGHSSLLYAQIEEVIHHRFGLVFASADWPNVSLLQSEPMVL